MKNGLLLLSAMILPMSGCADPNLTPMQNAMNARDAVERFAQDYANIRPHAIGLLPYLSPKDQTNLRNLMLGIEHALAIARAATEIGEQMAALEEARRSFGVLENKTDKSRVTHSQPGYPSDPNYRPPSSYQSRPEYR